MIHRELEINDVIYRPRHDKINAEWQVIRIVLATEVVVKHRGEGTEYTCSIDSLRSESDLYVYDWSL